MKKQIINSLLAASAVLTAACSQDEANVTISSQTRTIIVHCPDTRTTIEYEGSDYSHLVWTDGDRVAYVTDAADDVFKTAAVEANRFTAEVPAGMTSDNRLLVVWPAVSEGGPLEGVSTELAADIRQQAGADFDGSLLPMYADVEIPKDRDQVDAMYGVLGSVVRIGIDGTNHESEVLRSVTLTARENLVGSYAFDTATRSWTFSGKSNTVQVTMTGEEVLLSGKQYVYMVVNPAGYTGVTMTVETDADTYVYADGVMDVDLEGRTLYRIDVALDGQVKPVIPYFTQVTDRSELTPDGTYLIVTANKENLYYMTSGKSMSYLSPVAVEFTDDGVVKTEQTMNNSWKIVRDETSGKFTLFSVRLSQYVGSPGAILARDYGPLKFGDEIPQDDDEAAYYWNIEVDAQRALIGSSVMEETWFQFDANYNVRYFCACTPDTNGAQDVMIFKLRE